MKVKNKYVQIQIGNKTYTKRNMILNKYLEKIFESQINPSFDLGAEIKYCYIKLDTPLENIDYDSNLTGSEFDIILSSGVSSIIDGEKLFINNSVKSNSNVLINYKFTSDGSFQYKTSGWQNGQKNDFEMFNGRKITNIGFGNNGVYAILDVSDLNIIINSNEKVIITRVDLYQSDAICKGFDYPLHLVNFSAKYNAQDISGIESCVIAQLYSIGLGNTIGLMETEHVIDFESNDVVINDTNIEITFRDYIMKGIYPSERLFPRTTKLFPQLDTSKSIILKYRLGRINSTNNFITYLDEYYTMTCEQDFSSYINPEGEPVAQKSITLNLSIERM